MSKDSRENFGGPRSALAGGGEVGEGREKRESIC